MLRAPRVGPPEEAKETILRVAPGFGWFGLGVLAAGATAWAIFSRTGRSPSNGQEPDGQEPDVVLDVPELEVDRITRVRDLRPTSPSWPSWPTWSTYRSASTPGWTR